jgi:hypothetical protein
MRAGRIARTVALVSIGMMVCACGLLPKFTIHFPDKTVQVEIPDTGRILTITGLDQSEIIRGSGDRVTVNQEVLDFDQISVMGSGEIILNQDNEFSLSITADDNLIEYVQTKVENGTLALGYDPERARDKDLHPSKPIHFEITVPDLTGVSIYGSGDVFSNSLELDRFSIDIYGAGDFSVDWLRCQRMSIAVYGLGEVEIDDLRADSLSVSIPGKGTIWLSGEVTEQEIELPGQGNYMAKNLLSQVAYIGLSGMSDARIWVTDELYATIIGSGDIQYYGNPTVYHSGPGRGDLESLGNP